MIDIRKTESELIYDSLVAAFKKLEASLDGKADVGVSISGGPTLVLSTTKFIRPSMIWLALFDQEATVSVYLHTSNVNIATRALPRADTTIQRKPIGFNSDV